MTELSDAELVERFRQGDRSAFTQLVHRWDGPVLRIAFRIVGEQGEAEEVRQTVFLQLFESHVELRDSEKFAAWIRRCTVNTAISLLRKRRRRNRDTVHIELQLEAVDVASPAELVVEADESEQLKVAIGQLEPDDRALMSLRFDEGLTFQELTDVLDRPVSTVKSQFAKAMDRLRKLLNVQVGGGNQL
jgi:RNA polymerase sigma-70 factor (ECF subfamily)